MSSKGEKKAAGGAAKAGSDKKGKVTDNKRRNQGNRYDQIKVDVERPVKSEMEAKVKGLIEEIKGLHETIKKHRDEISKINEDTKGSKPEADAARAKMNTLQAERKALMDERSLIIQDRDLMNKQREAIFKDEQKIRAELKFRDIESCEAKIHELERKQAQTSMSLNEEKKLLKDIKALNDSKKMFEKLNDMQGEKDQSKLTRESIDKRYAEKAAQLNDVKKRIDAHRVVLEELTGASKEQRSGIPDLYKKIDAIKAEVAGKRGEIGALEKEFRAQEDVYFAAVKEAKRVIEEERAAEQERRRLEKEQKEREALEAELRRVPFEAELELCDSMCAYLEKVTKVHDAFQQLSLRSSITAPSSSANVSASSTSLDSGFKVYQKDDAVEQVGNLKKKKAPKKKSAMSLSSTTAPAAEGKPSSEMISHDEEKTVAFQYLEVVPVPVTVADIPSAMDAIKAKKAYFQTLTRDNKEVQTFAAFQKKDEKKNEVAESKPKKEVPDAPPGLAGDAAPVLKSKGGKTVFTVEQLSSAELFPSLMNTPVTNGDSSA